MVVGEVEWKHQMVLIVVGVLVDLVVVHQELQMHQQMVVELVINKLGQAPTFQDLKALRVIMVVILVAVQAVAVVVPVVRVVMAEHLLALLQEMVVLDHLMYMLMDLERQLLMPEAAVVLIKIMQLLDSAVKVDKVAVEEEPTTVIKAVELEQTVLAEAVEVETLLHTMAEME